MEEEYNHIEEVEMVKWSCCQCGCINMMPKALNKSLRSSHSVFYCPAGHGQSYTTPTSTQQLEEKLVAEYAKNAQLEARIAELEKGIIGKLNVLLSGK